MAKWQCHFPLHMGSQIQIPPSTYGHQLPAGFCFQIPPPSNWIPGNTLQCGTEVLRFCCSPPVSCRHLWLSSSPSSQQQRLHPHFQCRPVRVHSSNNWGQTVLNSYPANCNLPALSAHISTLLASSMPAATCRLPEAPWLEATRAQHLS